MAHLKKLIIDGYRSVDHAELVLPDDAPLILIGENNAGKSNIIRALDLLCGEMWPSSHAPEDNEFYQRARDRTIEIKAEFSESLGRWGEIRWRYDSDADPQVEFGGVDAYGHVKWLKGEERGELIAVTINADRRLSYQLGYSSKYTMLSKLMHRFHKAMLENDTVREALQEIFRQTKEAFSVVAEFAAFRQSLREDFADLIKTMTHRLDVDFEAYNPVNFFHALRLQADEGGEPRTLEELGTGEEQMLALAFAHAYAKAFHGGILLAIEEPEAHFHPLAQEWLAKKITLMAKDGLQIVLTTHSPAFVDLLNIDGLALVSKSEDSGTSVVQRSCQDVVDWCISRGVPPGQATADTIQDFYHASATNDIKAGFFAKRVVLVEGPTEALALPVYLSAIGLDCSVEGIAVVPVGGKGSLAKWWRLFTAYKIPTYVVFDNDGTEDTDGRRCGDVLAAIAEDDPADVLEIDDIHIEEHYAVFGTDFEGCLRALFPNYEALEREAKQFLRSGSKPLIARYVARNLVENRDPDDWSWTHFDSLAESIRSVTAP
jgi:putative ATP-dependent endonuclease of OLD family